MTSNGLLEGCRFRSNHVGDGLLLLYDLHVFALLPLGNADHGLDLSLAGRIIIQWLGMLKT